MAWTPGSNVSTGDLISAANWNNYNGAAGDHEHLHSELHVATSALAHSSGNVWQFGQDYLSGKILTLYWNHVAIPPTSALGWINENTPSQITFTTTMTSALNNGSATVSGNLVWATYVLSE